MTYWNGSGWEADRPANPPRPKRGRRFLGAVSEATLIVLLVFGLIAGTSLAAAGGNGGGGGKPIRGGGTLALVVVSDSDADGVVSHGDSITFDVTTAADRPYVSVKCHQGGTLVYAASAGFFADYPWSKIFGLGTSSWASGGADCLATLYTTKDGSRITTLATLTFFAGD